MAACMAVRVKKPLRALSLVRVKVVPYGKSQWGIAATLDGARSFINYEVGDRAAAEAEAKRLETTARASKPAGAVRR